jgi:selenophosphate synthase
MTVLNRSVVGTEGDATDVGMQPPRIVAAAFVDGNRGGDATAFHDLLSDAYRTWTRGGQDIIRHDAARTGLEHTGDEGNASNGQGVTVVKGHSIQLDGANEPVVWGERMVPSGRRCPGYCAVNVDVVHAFPKITPDRQAAIAVFHALNDCYTQGATDDRDVRPIVAAPAGTQPGRGRVRRWFRAAAPASVTIHEPSIVTHDGRGWQFGASTTAATNRTPPVRRTAIEPGDEVVVHRPLGALALYAGDVDDKVSLDSSVRERTIEALTADHVAIAREIAASCPASDETFDPDQHLKWVCDISGPGIGGLVRTIRDQDCGLHLESLPLIDRGGIDAVRDAWAVPDVTVETNGPLAAVGTPSVLDRFERHLEEISTADPSRLGRVIDVDGLRWDPEIALERYAERLARQQGP